MEGRTIARPYLVVPRLVSSSTDSLQWRAGQLPGHTRDDATQSTSPTPCFNGGPDNCPAIRRPRAATRKPPPRFNGGPDNCPAIHVDTHSPQEPLRGFNGGPDNCPAIPGRGRRHRRRRSCFNGGPDNCPAIPAVLVGLAEELADASMEGRTIARPYVAEPERVALMVAKLQWRAGQLPGHTD